MISILLRATVVPRLGNYRAVTMANFTEQQLENILNKHELWLNNEGGERANLRNANLWDANLWGADLRNANLWGADLWGCPGNRNEIKSLFLSSEYPVTYTGKYLQIGCEKHLITEWWEFDNKIIGDMGGKKALKFWKKYKAFIKSAIELSPAVETKE